MADFQKNHLVLTADQATYVADDRVAGISTAFSRWPIVNNGSGSVHQDFSVCRLEAGGHVPAHIHSYEESIYVLAGTIRCDTPHGSVLMSEGDYGVFQVASPHAFTAVGDGPSRWAEMAAPQPRRADGSDLYLADPLPVSEPPLPVDARDPRTLSFGNIRPENMDPGMQTQDMLAMSASMRTALLVYSGITVKMMVDSDLGASLQTMFMVQYEPGGYAGAHDHPFEETYLILDGEVLARFDGAEYPMGPGDVAFAGVNCVHEFSNIGAGRVRWLETQAPQPPGRYSYRFARDWQYLESKTADDEQGESQ